MERLHNGSEEEGWPKEDSEKILSEEKHAQGNEKESDQKAALTSAVRTNTKAGSLPAFLFSAVNPDDQRE
jgi:hypothetical protein